MVKKKKATTNFYPGYHFDDFCNTIQGILGIDDIDTDHFILDFHVTESKDGIDIHILPEGK